jgi:POT family proton-dependent oligopeptide transporter
MGVWFSANFYGHFFAGKIAKLTSVTNGENNLFSEGIFGSITKIISGLEIENVQQGSEALQQLYSYVSIYNSFGIISILVGIFAIVIAPYIKKIMVGIH